MRYYCHDPFSAVSRVIDTARRLDLHFSTLHYDRLADGRFRLCIGLVDEGCHAAMVFAARLDQIIELEAEACYA